MFVGIERLELSTPAVSERCSNQLSYIPIIERVVRIELTYPTWKEGIMAVILYSLIFKELMRGMVDSNHRPID